MAMSFQNYRLFVCGGAFRIILDHTRIKPEAHCRPQVGKIPLVRHEIYYRVKSALVKFGTVGVFQPGDVTRELDDHTLHSETQAEKRDVVFAGVSDGDDHSLNPAHAESARNQNTVNPFKLPLQISFAYQRLGIYPLRCRRRIRWLCRRV